ncbi:MAG: hypothetical protein MUC83_01990 [Pirellula sp.]|nr:hypothetical protein [Pirellula sp.]
MFSALVAKPSQAEPPLVAKLTSWVKGKGKQPVTKKDVALEDLAANVDWLENHLNQWGSVTAKSPDVWGEARLTQFRVEIEKRLKAELDSFDKSRLSGLSVVTDAASLQSAMSIDARATPSTNPLTSPDVTAGAASVTSGAPSVHINQSIGSLPNSFLSPNVNPAPFFQLFNAKNVQLEQTQELDNLNRYLNHIGQLRRINEGDDTSDAPGYSLNLVRIPVSLLPGTLSQKGYGAEITVTANPYLGPELLPMVYRDLVTNDLVDQLSIPLTRFFNSDPNRTDRIMGAVKAYYDMPALLDRFNRDFCGKPLLLHPDVLSVIKQMQDLDFFHDGILQRPIQFDERELYALSLEIERISKQVASYMRCQASDSLVSNCKESTKIVDTTDQKVNPVDESRTVTTSKALEVVNDIENKLGAKLLDTRAMINQASSKVGGPLSPSGVSEISIKAVIDSSASNVEQVVPSKFALPALKKIQDYAAAMQYLASVNSISFGASGNRRSKLPFPPTQLVDVYSEELMAQLAAEAWQGFREDLPNKRVVQVMDAKAFLREEIGAAMELVNSECMFTWWDRESTGERYLYNLIRTRQSETMASYRQEFIEHIASQGKSRLTAILAWSVFVESILLNERLNDDVRETAGTRPACGCGFAWQAYFGPNPTAQARQQFSDYVRCRWPIRVFALDPVNDQQSIGETSQIYRQMQLAVALAVSGGEIGLSSAMDIIRKLQREAATVDLNRTSIAFGHGENTFGWRFEPRFQTPPVEGNAKVLFRDLIGGGPTDRQLERSQKIEPGMRECAAIVLMPSFVPHITFETRGNWYKLVRPGHTGTSIQDDVKMSRAIKQMQDQAQECIRCSHLYRDGEVDRVMSRVYQLEQRLPMQSISCQVPIENVKGGFEVFSGGTRELAPELSGWYGSPGYTPSRGGSFFLAGDNFSIRETNIIAGNHRLKEDSEFNLISRQIIWVNLPPNLPILTDSLLKNHDSFEQIKEFVAGIPSDVKYEGYIDVHVATPYGASGHLLIPVVQESREAVTPALFSTDPRSLSGSIKLKRSKGILSFDSCVLNSPLMMSVSVDRTTSLGNTSRPIRLYLSHGENQLGAINFKTPIASTTGASFTIPADDLVESASKGELKKQLDSYVTWLISVNQLPPDMIEFQGRFTVEVDKQEVPVKGHIVLRLNWSE